jgi:hypothetical protein
MFGYMHLGISVMDPDKKNMSLTTHQSHPVIEMADEMEFIFFGRWFRI